MTKSYLASFPKLDQNLDWILQFRSQHDPKAQLIPTHLTLVYPTEILSPAEIWAEASKLVASVPKFRFVSRSVLVVSEDKNTNAAASIFLVPDEGFQEVVQLHDLLYSARLKPALRTDIPFIPHVTIGSNLELQTARNLAHSLESKKFKVELIIDQLQAVTIEDPSKPRTLSKPIKLL